MVFGKIGHYISIRNGNHVPLGNDDQSRLLSKTSKDANLKELLSGSAITFVLKMIGMGLGYIAVYLISKKNGSEGVGYYSLINQLLLLLGVVATLGTNVSVLRYIGQYNKPGEKGQLRHLYGRVVQLIIPASILLGVLVFLLSEPIAVYLFQECRICKCHSGSRPYSPPFSP